MRFDTSQQMKMGQHLKLAPRVIQSMEILQMPLQELGERIEQELSSNAVLAEPNAQEWDLGSEGDGAADPNQERGGESAEGFGNLDDFEAANPDAAANEFSSGEARADRSRDSWDAPARRAASGDRDAKMDAMANAAARGASPHEQLLDQWHICDVRDDLRAPGELIIDALDDDGYLRTPLEEIAARAPRTLNGALAPDSMEDALRAVQLFLEPAGVAARNARECLLLQIDALEDRDDWSSEDDKRETVRVARELVADYLEDLMNNRLPKIAERSGLSLTAIKGGLMFLRRLSLAPMRALAPDRNETIVPDAIVEYDEEEDRYVAYLNDSTLPNLRINREYADLVRDRAMPKRDRDFIRTNVSNAQWLIDAVEQRRHTLQRVLNVVVEAQRDAFDYGPEAIKPLQMTHVAEQLGIHVATVSRAVADKYLQTPRGVIALRRFFTGGTETASGEEASWEAIRAALQDVIDNEDKTKPLSDEALAEALKDRGIPIARRTVAKYRSQLDIPSARLRKQFE